MPKIKKIEAGESYTLPCTKGGWSNTTAKESGLLLILTDLEKSVGGAFVSMDDLLKHLAGRGEPK